MAAQGALHVLQAVDTAFEDDRGDGAFFIPSSSWKGPKAGYAFKTGDLGLGYYRETEAADQAQDGEGRPGDGGAGSSKRDAAELLEEAEQLAEDLKELENIDDRGIRRIVAGVERRIRKNQEQRMKYSDDPQRFLDSELELNEVLTKLSALAGEPVLYTQLVEQQTVPLLLELLQHENIDIVSPVVELLKDLTDADSVEDLEEECMGLVQAVLKNQGVVLMTARLQQFKETVEEGQNGVGFMLQCFQNMTEIDPEVPDALANHSELVSWLVSRVHIQKFPKYDENKGLAALLLATIAQSSAVCRKKLLAEGAIDRVVVTMSSYRKLKKPLEDKDEEEFLMELCNVLSVCCMDAAGKQQFLEFEGIELMFIILRNRQMFRIGCLKVLAMVTTEFQRTADLCVEVPKSLPVLFGMFMGGNKTMGVKQHSDDARQQLETVVSVIANLMHYCKKQNSERVAAKFVENEFEKADRLMELFFQYHNTLRAAMHRIKQREDIENDEIDEELRAAGQFVVQQLSVIFGYLWATGDLLLRKRLLMLLHQQKATLTTVRAHLSVLYAEIIQQVEDVNTRSPRVKLARLIVTMGGEATVPRPTSAPPLPPPDCAASPGAKETAADATAADPPLPDDTDAQPPLPREEEDVGKDVNGSSGKRRTSEGQSEDHEMEEMERGRERTNDQEAGDGENRNGRKQVELDRDGDNRHPEERNGRDRGSDRDRDRARERDNDRVGYSDSGRYGDRDGERGRERDRDRGRNRDTERERESERERDRARGRDRDGGRERDRRRDRDRDRDRDRERERDRDRDRDRGSNRDRYRDRDGVGRHEGRSRR